MHLVSLDQPFQWVQVEFKCLAIRKSQGTSRDQWWISIGHSHGTHLFDFSRWYWQDRAKEHVRNDESLRRTLHKRLHEERGKVGTSSVRSQLSEFLNLGSSSIPLSRSRFKPSQRGFGFKLFRSIWFRMILIYFDAIHPFLSFVSFLSFSLALHPKFWSRKGFIDGRTARLPTVIVRPGKPNAATTSCYSGSHGVLQTFKILQTTRDQIT